VSGAHFSIEQLSRLRASSVASALAYLRANPPHGTDCAERAETVPRLALFSCMVEQFLPVPLDLLGIRSLLMIDDEPAVLRSMARVLRQIAPALQIHSADGGNDGMAQVLRQNPGAVLIDAYMPVLSGVEVCARIRAADAHLALFGMTADPSPELAAAFARAGAAAFFEKPVDVPAFFEALSVHLDVPNSAGDW
jgi:CheY-like chemotaxis protein